MKKTKIKKDLFNRIKEIGSENKIRGITLISLIVSIVVLLILAVFTINFVIDNGVILSKTKKATDDYELSKQDEQNVLNDMNDKIEFLGSNRDSKSAFTKLYNDEIVLQNANAGRNWSTIDVDIPLEDSIENYDIIVFDMDGYHNTAGSYGWNGRDFVITKNIEYNNPSAGYNLTKAFIEGGVSNRTYSIGFYFKDKKTIKFTSTASTVTWMTNIKVKSIYGIKY